MHCVNGRCKPLIPGSTQSSQLCDLRREFIRLQLIDSTFANSSGRQFWWKRYVTLAYETAARERERALADSRDHLLSTLRMLESDRAALKARETRITELEAQVEDYRRQLSLVITRAVAKNRALVERKPRSAPRPKSKRPAKRRVSPKKPRRQPKLKCRSKR
jgi:hypothetical protein